ncbi:DUF4178 domain-containing protein [Bryobacter aggregatus]|uniref:DUF4178 domain-containing protein n=1 Tax=Bryobacter aggregatus TaxID=360054 RepID=UPI0004E12007|nr:DUF4178 domain-containing protein [Bryobacter aggregatus]
MSQVTQNCPQCGGPVVFRWSQSVQTTCPYCSSILVRTDVDLTKVGQVSDYPLDPSPIQIGSEGVVENKPFVVIGRICYEYSEGGWNEWHIVFNTGENAWLSDAQLEYAVTKQIPWVPALNGQKLDPGVMVDVGGAYYTVATITSANYRAVEGELPFQFWDKTVCRFIDLRSYDDKFLTIDYTENPPVLFAGRTFSFDALKLKNLRHFEGWQ